MKTQFKFLLFAATFFAGTLAASGFQSEAEEVPGDNFSLEGALELFKKSKSPQEFEQLLNSPDSRVNNLDLNGDGEIDYIRITDKNEGNVHAFILSAVVSNNESQDVAVIELEKRNDGTAVLQIVGDADVYGIETIIEPTEEVRVNAGTSTARSVVNVWTWPSVQYIYSPAYTLWVSPWRWSYYPIWYRPWRPIAWYTYNPYWAPYRPYYSVCYRHRIAYAPVIYRPYRSTSVIVYNRNYTQISNFRNTSHSYRYDRGSDHRNHYDNNRSRNYTRNGRSTDGSSGRTSGSRSYDRGRSTNDASTQRFTRPERSSNEGSTRPTRTFTPTQRDNNNDVNRSRSNATRSFENQPNERSTSFRRSEPNNNNATQRPTRQFQAPAQRQQSPVQQFHRSEAPSHRSISPAPGGGSRPHSGGAPAGGGGGSSHPRGRH